MENLMEWTGWLPAGCVAALAIEEGLPWNALEGVLDLAIDVLGEARLQALAVVVDTLLAGNACIINHRRVTAQNPMETRSGLEYTCRAQQGPPAHFVVRQFCQLARLACDTQPYMKARQARCMMKLLCAYASERSVWKRCMSCTFMIGTAGIPWIWFQWETLPVPISRMGRTYISHVLGARVRDGHVEWSHSPPSGLVLAGTVHARIFGHQGPRALLAWMGCSNLIAAKDELSCWKLRFPMSNH